MTTADVSWPKTPFNALGAAFIALTRPPAQLTLDLGDQIRPDGLPDGMVTLPDIQQWMLHQRHAYAARDLIWRELIRRAREDGPAWVVVATAMALPALRRHARQLSVGLPRGDEHDLQAEILTGFLTALRHHLDITRAAPYAALCRHAWRAGFLHRQRERDQASPTDDIENAIGPRTPQRPYGHPDLLVRRARELGLINDEDEQPYIDLRLGHRSLEPVAAKMGITPDALRMRVSRIDTRLAAAIRDGLLSDAVSPTVRSAVATEAARRRSIRAGRSAGARRRNEEL